MGPSVQERRKTLRTIDPEAVVLFPGSFRSAWICRGIGKVRIGVRQDSRSWWLTHAFPRGTSRPRATHEHYADLVEHAVGIRPGPPHSLRAKGRGIDRSGIVLVPGASRPFKRWPESRFVVLAKALQTYQEPITLIGAPAEQTMLNAIARKIPDSKVICNERLPQTLESIKKAKILVGNDTGPRHLAALFGTPCVTLFGPTDPRWAPPTQYEHALRSQPFAPGELVANDAPGVFHLERISVGDVVSAVQQVMANQYG